MHTASATDRSMNMDYEPIYSTSKTPKTTFRCKKMWIPDFITLQIRTQYHCPVPLDYALYIKTIIIVLKLEYSAKIPAQ